MSNYTDTTSDGGMDPRNDPQSDSARLARMRRECSPVHPDVAAARRADDERLQAERDQATREDERQRLIAAGWKQPGIEEVRAVCVGSIHVSHLNQPLGPRCREVLLYSPDTPRDNLQDRVMLYTDGSLPDALLYAESDRAQWHEQAETKARHLVAVQATARVAIGHLRAVLNKPRTSDEQLRADTLARDWLTSIGW